MASAPRGQRLFWAITLGIGLLSAAALAELALRIAKPMEVGFHEQPCVYWSDAEWGYRYRPGAVGRKHFQFDLDNEVRINSAGWHDVERAPEVDADALHLVAVGDSFTAAIHVPVEQGWTQRVERVLSRELARSVRVDNLGLDGTGTSVHRAVLERMLPERRPDVVLLGFFYNDVEETARGPVFRECYQGFVVNYQDDAQREALRRVVDESRPSDRERWWFDRVYLLRVLPFAFGRDTHALLRENYLSPSRFGVPVGTPDAERTLAAHIDAILALEEEWGFRLFVVPIPPLGDPAASHARLREELPAATWARLEVVDVGDDMLEAARRVGIAWRSLFWRRDAHWNAVGNRLFGDAVARALSERLGTGEKGVAGSPRDDDSSL